MKNKGKKNVLGVHIDAVDYDAAVEQIIEKAEVKRPFVVSALAVHGVMTGVLDAEHRYRLNSLDLVVPDGQPVRWAINWLYGCALRDRVYGPELMLRLCDAASRRSALSIFLFGSTDSVLRRLRLNLEKKFPGLRIAGVRASLFRILSEKEKDELANEINDSGASIVFVGLGCPRQEVWAYEFRAAISMPVIAVGAAFDFHAGLTKQAPLGMQRAGLEWLYRLMIEPVRLWKRYVFLNPFYLLLLLLQKSGFARFFRSKGKKPSEEILYG